MATSASSLVRDLESVDFAGARGFAGPTWTSRDSFGEGQDNSALTYLGPGAARRSDFQCADIHKAFGAVSGAVEGALPFS